MLRLHSPRICVVVELSRRVVSPMTCCRRAADLDHARRKPCRSSCVPESLCSHATTIRHRVVMHVRMHFCLSAVMWPYLTLGMVWCTQSSRRRARMYASLHMPFASFRACRSVCRGQSRFACRCARCVCKFRLRLPSYVLVRMNNRCMPIVGVVLYLSAMSIPSTSIVIFVRRSKVAA